MKAKAKATVAAKMEQAQHEAKKKAAIDAKEKDLAHKLNKQKVISHSLKKNVNHMKLSRTERQAKRKSTSEKMASALT